MEIWKDINGYFGLYQISNNGNIRNCKNFKILKNRLRKGYNSVVLYKDKIPNVFSIHRLVAIHFLGFESDKFVNHIDRDKLNNKVNNLEWVNVRENITHSYSKELPTGVSIKKGTNRFVSQIYYNGKKHHIGYFDNPIDASNAYKQKLIELNLTNKYS
jgi:hypothetical protein